MFFVRRTFSQLARSSVRDNIRFYCNASTKFKNKEPSAFAGKTHTDKSNETEENKEKSNDSERTEDSGKESNNSDEKTSDQNNESDKNLMIRGNFEHISNKNRETFVSMVNMFVDRDVHRRNHVEFIYAALKQMKHFGVNKDLEVYKALIDVMPKGKFIATNMFQAEFMHYPKQQNCIIFLLDQMEYNNVLPDQETEDLLINIFGRRAHPVYKLWRMMYWMPKFRYLSPWLLPNPLPNDALELAKIAVKQMCTVDVESVVEIFQTKVVEGCLDKTWIVSGQSPEQKKLLSTHSPESPLKIEGPFKIQLRNHSVTYFTLIGDAEPDENFENEGDIDDVQNLRMPKFLKFLSPKERAVAIKKPKRSIHQQDDGTIYGICATGTSTKDSLLSWIRLLEKHGNPCLETVPVLFKFKSPVDDKALIVVNNNEEKK